jgi:HAD superfamily hydrolase (TIGR01662 family)
MRRAVILDRDGTLVHDPGYLGDPAGVRPLPHVGESLRALADAGFLLVVATNQSGIARGRYDEAAYRAVAASVEAALAAEGVRLAASYFCPFHPEGTVPAYARRAAQQGLAASPALAALFDDALASELVINQLRQPDPALAAVLHRLSGPFAPREALLRAAQVASGAVLRVALAPHARLGVYGRDVAALQASARSRLAGFLSSAEWTAALDRLPALAVRAGRQHAAHVLRPTGEVATFGIDGATFAALSAGPCGTGDPATRDDLLRLAAAGALRPA